jgi:bifunctional N-acetylglucosamine-1-phosphate-uridyltransferase/glucosamine-1-phosphate-acetyltransferase GlmU-like protein
MLLGDIGNRLDIEDTEREISKLKQQIRNSTSVDLNQDQKISELENENAELKLYMAALIRLLLSKGAITNDELTRMVEEIDGADGRVDGKFNGSIHG